MAWHSTIAEQPTDGTTVWIRLAHWFGTPGQAVWDAATATFTPAGLTAVPWYLAPRWRDL